MSVLTAFAIGLSATAMRSVFCCMLAGCLIIAVFALAAAVSGGAVSWNAFALALVGYNIGIAAMLGATGVAIARRQI